MEDNKSAHQLLLESTLEVMNISISKNIDELDKHIDSIFKEIPMKDRVLIIETSLHLISSQDFILGFIFSMRYFQQKHRLGDIATLERLNDLA